MNDLTVGKGILLDGQIFLVTEYKHVKPGKGGAFVRTKLKNLKSGLVMERTFKPGEKLEEASITEEKIQFLYKAGNIFHFMNQSTYEQLELSEDKIESNIVKFLQENLDVSGIFSKGHLQKIILPTFIKAEIIETEPGLKGDSSKAGTKPAKIDTATTVQVPLFINTGDWVKIDTRSGEYVERVQR